MTINTPLRSKKRISKNFSCDNYDIQSSGKTIYKIRDRLFSPSTLSLLSKNDYNFSRNYLKNPTPNNLDEEQLKNFRFKSFDNQAYVSYIPLKKTLKKAHSTIEENKIKNEKKPGPSVIFLRDIKLGEMPTITGRHNPDQKKLLLINQIIKFNVYKKKEEAKKNLLPMKLGKEYHDFIERKNKIFFNPNFNSPFIHKMNSNYMLKTNLFKFHLGTPTTKNKLKIKRQKQIEEEEQIQLELKDQMEELSVDLQYYKKAIKVFLTDETKLNQIIIHEDFFDSFVNKINFLFDDRKFPTIKNNLEKITLELIGVGGLEWTRMNMIEVSTLTYLHKLKAKIQRELDEIEEENKEKQFKINQQIGKYDINNSNKKKKKRKNIYKTEENEKGDEDKNRQDNSNDSNLNNKDKENESNEEENEEQEEDEKIINKEDLYNLEEFFVHKGVPNKKIEFATGKLAYTVYHNQKFYSESSGKIYKKEKKMKKKKKEYDIYL